MKIAIKEDRHNSFSKSLLSLLLSAVILSIQVISDFRVDERRGISSCLRRGDEAEVTIRYFLSVGQERGSERERAFIVREEEEVVGEGGRRRWRRRNEERADGGGGYNCTIFPEACQLLPGFTNLVDRTKFEGHCSSSSYLEESLYINLRKFGSDRLPL